MTRGNVSINANKRMPTGKPPFTIATLRKAIPEHCFKRSLTTSCAYLAADLLLVAVLFGLSQLVEARAPWWLAVIFWPAYWFFQVSTLLPLTHQVPCDSELSLRPLEIIDMTNEAMPHDQINSCPKRTPVEGIQGEHLSWPTDCMHHRSNCSGQSRLRNYAIADH